MAERELMTGEQLLLSGPPWLVSLQNACIDMHLQVMGFFGLSEDLMHTRYQALLKLLESPTSLPTRDQLLEDQRDALDYAGRDQ